MDTTTLPPKGKLTLHYYLLQIGFWGGIGCFTGFQSVIVLDRGFTSADVGVFVAICNLAGILFQPQLGAWADRHPEIPLKRIFLCCILTALGLNTVFLFTRPGFPADGPLLRPYGHGGGQQLHPHRRHGHAVHQRRGRPALQPGPGPGVPGLRHHLHSRGAADGPVRMQTALMTHAVMLVILAVFTLSFPAFPGRPGSAERAGPPTPP